MRVEVVDARSTPDDVIAVAAIEAIIAIATIPESTAHLYQMSLYIDQLAKVSEGFSGAEIEQAVIAAMYEAFAQDREFTQLDIIAAIKSTLPLSKTMTEQVTALRDWARQRARPAASSLAEYQRMEF